MDTRALKELADDFRAHPLSRGVSDCEKIGEALFDAVGEIERLRIEIARLLKGEYICQRCGVRKDSEHPITHDF